MYYKHRYNFIGIMIHHFHLIFNQIDLNYDKILMKINKDVLSLFPPHSFVRKGIRLINII